MNEKLAQVVADSAGMDGEWVAACDSLALAVAAIPDREVRLAVARAVQKVFRIHHAQWALVAKAVELQAGEER